MNSHWRAIAMLGIFGGCSLFIQLINAKDIPKTLWGAPNLQGIWTNATATPLERPAQYANIKVLPQDQRSQFGEAVLEQYGKGGREATNGGPECNHHGRLYILRESFSVCIQS